MKFSLRDILWLITCVALLSVIYWQFGIVKKAQAQAMALDRERTQAIAERDYHKRERGKMFIWYTQAASKLDRYEHPESWRSLKPDELMY